MPAGDLLPNPKNWRTHPAPQKDAMRGVLAEIGWADACLARETAEGLMLIDGHLRTDVAPATNIPVLVLDVTAAEADKILATHDPLAAMAGANADMLGDLLGGLDMSSEAAQKMLDDLAKDNGLAEEESAEEDGGGEVDRAEELAEKWGTAAGQLWAIEGKANHRLICGDSTQAAVRDRVLGDATPFIMVTDPPYGVEYDPGWRNDAIAFAERREGTVFNDDRIDWADAYSLFPGCVAYVWHAGRHAADLVVNLRDADFAIRTQIIWKKPAFAISRGHYHWQHEPCWYAVRKGSSKWCGDRSQSTIWDISNKVDQNDNTNHGTQKPIECMARPIRNHGGQDDDVYDPFLGSGTTMVAAEQLGRRCFGMEIDPGYCAVILDRMVNQGCEPRLVEDGP